MLVAEECSPTPDCTSTQKGELQLRGDPASRSLLARAAGDVSISHTATADCRANATTPEESIEMPGSENVLRAI